MKNYQIGDVIQFRSQEGVLIETKLVIGKFRVSNKLYIKFLDFLKSGRFSKRTDSYPQELFDKFFELLPMEIYYLKDDKTFKVIQKKGSKLTETILSADKVEELKLRKNTFMYYLKTMKLVTRKEINYFIKKNKIDYSLPEVQLQLDLEYKLFN